MDEFDYNSVPPKKEFKLDVKVNNLAKGEPLPCSKMSDEQFKEMAKFEDEATKNVTGPMAISPNLMQQMKPKQHFFYVAWQDETGKIIDIKHYDDYDTALMKSMEKAKETNSSWTIYSLTGRFIDGNYKSK